MGSTPSTLPYPYLPLPPASNLHSLHTYQLLTITFCKCIIIPINCHFINHHPPNSQKMSFRSLHLGPTTINNVLAPPLLPRSRSNLSHGGATTPVLSSSFLPLNSFVTRKQRPALPPSASPRVSMRLASGSKQAYICRDCGFIYSDRTPFDKLPDKYFCPVCGAPKRRFRPYEQPVDKNANSKDVRKARKEQIKQDESIGKALPYAIAVGIIALAGLYFYLNSTF